MKTGVREFEDDQSVLLRTLGGVTQKSCISAAARVPPYAWDRANGGEGELGTFTCSLLGTAVRHSLRLSAARTRLPRVGEGGRAPS